MSAQHAEVAAYARHGCWAGPARARVESGHAVPGSGHRASGHIYFRSVSHNLSKVRSCKGRLYLEQPTKSIFFSCKDLSSTEYSREKQRTGVRRIIPRRTYPEKHFPNIHVVREKITFFLEKKYSFFKRKITLAFWVFLILTMVSVDIMPANLTDLTDSKAASHSAFETCVRTS